MKTKVKINKKYYEIKTREQYAPKEKVVPLKKRYKRSRDNKIKRYEYE